MSPILVRPVREQLEHDRIIRLLQTKFRRRFEVGINPGAEQGAPLPTGVANIFPDLVLSAQDRGRKPQVIVEVETVESVNNLEAMAEWVTFARLKPAFHLYVPAQMADVAKRLCTDLNVAVAEIHSYHAVGDELRFVQVYRAPADSHSRSGGAAQPKKKAAAKAARPAKKTAKPAKPARAAKKPAARSPKRK